MKIPRKFKPVKMALCINNSSSDVMVVMLMVAFVQAFVLKLLKSLYNDIMIGAEEDAKTQREASELEAKERAIKQSIEEGTSRYSDLSSREEEGDEETGCVEIRESCSCPICLDDFEGTDEVFHVKTCRHEFHKECIKKWLCDRKKLSCPYCREPILTIEQEREESILTFSVIQLLNSSIVWKYRRTLFFVLCTEAAVCVAVILQINGC